MVEVGGTEGEGRGRGGRVKGRAGEMKGGGSEGEARAVVDDGAPKRLEVAGKIVFRLKVSYSGRQRRSAM